mgnify:CR=1 FL=1
MIWQWLLDNYIEVLGALTGLIYLYFSLNQIIWLWLLGIITSALYIFVFFNSGLYADMGLQVYYLIISVYGWIHWLKGGKTEKNPEEKNAKLPVSSLKRKYIIALIVITGIMTILLGMLLSEIKNSSIPYWDAFTTSGSIIATWMLARKYIENWIFWIIIDLIAMGTYVYKGLYPTVILFFVYTLMAVIGYIEWKKDLIKKQSE